MEDVDSLPTVSDPLLACCLCRRLLQEAVQLTCLHSCCRQCFSTAASKDSSQGIRCSLCSTVTQEGSEQRNRFIDSQVQRYKSIPESILCRLCKENGKRDKPAVLWCPACRHSLCGDCDVEHGKYLTLHATQLLEELGSLAEVCLPTSPSAGCAIHKKPVDIACVNCEKAMCISCWAECKEKKHEMHIVGQEAFDAYVDKVIASISTMERELLQKSELLETPKNIFCDTKAARDRHLKELNMRKRRVVEAVETVYQQIELSTKDSYDNIEALAEDEAAAADRIASALADARSYIRRLVESNDGCEILNQQKIVRERLSVLSAEVDSLSNRLSTAVIEVKIDATLPEDLEEVVRTWIGVPRLCSASSSLPQPHVQQQQQCFTFGAASANIELPVDCCDIALTKDGRSLLLAAREHGLLEFSSSCGHELSRWRPPKYRADTDDEVWAVAALSDGLAAVSLLYTELVVLLRRNDKGSSSGSSIAAAVGDTWTEYLRFDLVPGGVRLLSAHGDVLAASLWSCSGLQLLSLSSGRRLSNAALQREYVIGSLAVTAGVVVTGSYDKVELGGGRRAAHVLDAHSIAEGGCDERLWRHVLSSSDVKEEEEQQQLYGVCADYSGGCLYAAVWMSDLSNSRVCVLSLADGSELRRLAVSFDSAAFSWRLSLSDCATPAAEQQRQSGGNGSSSRGGRVVLLAALHWNETTVTVHRSVNAFSQ